METPVLQWADSDTVDSLNSTAPMRQTGTKSSQKEQNPPKFKAWSFRLTIKADFAGSVDKKRRLKEHISEYAEVLKCKRCLDPDHYIWKRRDEQPRTRGAEERQKGWPPSNVYLARKLMKQQGRSHRKLRKR